MLIFYVFVIDPYLFFHSCSCPFDQIHVYDGSSKDDPLIGTYCGQKRNLVLYSSGENIMVTFTTLPRSAAHENRGFIGWFEFSERFVNLGSFLFLFSSNLNEQKDLIKMNNILFLSSGFIGKNDGEHIRGTECDQKILSRKENNGTIYSPNYPFLYHSNIICKYHIYGIQDEQHLEKIRLEFEKFEIPIVKDKLKANGALSIPLGVSSDSINSIGTIDETEPVNE